MSVAEFEEKEFEGLSNMQLGSCGLMWAPGQVLEAAVGFDVALQATNAVFWAARGFPTAPPGAVVAPAWWPAASASAFAGRAPPPFAMNVFLQYKRPNHLARVQALEWPTWQQAYFRFLITSHQQAALDACARALGRNGLVAYACPAFHLRVDLWSHAGAQTLIANTHFAPASVLTGHGRYTYVNATTPGCAHSDPLSVEPLTILNGGGSPDAPPGGPADGWEHRSPLELLQEARQAAEAAIAASPTLVGSRSLHEKAVARAQRIVPSQHDGIRDFIYTATFSTMSGIRWDMVPRAAPARAKTPG
jgi:hypothetical protein